MQQELRKREPCQPIRQAAEARDFVLSYQQDIDPIVSVAPLLVAIAGRPHISNTEATNRLAEVERLTEQLQAISIRFEQAAAELPPKIAGHSRLDDFRQAIGSTRRLVERARLELAARTN